MRVLVVEDEKNLAEAIATRLTAEGYAVEVSHDGDDGLFEIIAESRIRKIPEDFALVVRTLILLNGLSHRLVPGRRLIQGELLKHLAAGAARAPARESAEVAA